MVLERVAARKQVRNSPSGEMCSLCCRASVLIGVQHFSESPQRPSTPTSTGVLTRTQLVAHRQCMPPLVAILYCYPVGCWPAPLPGPLSHISAAMKPTHTHLPYPYTYAQYPSVYPTNWSCPFHVPYCRSSAGPPSVWKHVIFPCSTWRVPSMH